MFARTRGCPRGQARVRADASFLSPGNFITDAIVHLSHGRPSGHRPTLRPFVRYRLRDNPVWHVWPPVWLCQALRLTRQAPHLIRLAPRRAPVGHPVWPRLAPHRAPRLVPIGPPVGSKKKIIIFFWLLLPVRKEEKKYFGFRFSIPKIPKIPKIPIQALFLSWVA
jgi:hypothetical protein